MPKPRNPASEANRSRDAAIIRRAAAGETPKHIGEALGMDNSLVARIIRVAKLQARYRPETTRA